MYGSSDAEYDKAQDIDEIIKTIKHFDAAFLFTKTSMEINELITFHDALCERLKKHKEIM